MTDTEKKNTILSLSEDLLKVHGDIHAYLTEHFGIVAESKDIAERTKGSNILDTIIDNLEEVRESSREICNRLRIQVVTKIH